MIVRLQLDERWIEYVCRLPESGMGYHIVDITLRTGERVANIVVLNAEQLEWPAHRPPIRSTDIVRIDNAPRRQANPA